MLVHRGARAQSRTPRTARRLVLPAGAALGAAVLLSACGAQSPGAAAIVNGRVISDSDVQTVTQQINTSPRLQQKLTPRDVLVSEIIGPWVIDAAAAAGHGVSEAQAIALAPEIKNPAPATVQFLRVNGSAQELPQNFGQQLAAELAKAKITVNPRYGTFDRKTFSVNPITEDWLVPAKTPAPTATPQ